MPEIENHTYWIFGVVILLFCLVELQVFYVYLRTLEKEARDVNERKAEEVEAVRETN